MPSGSQRGPLASGETGDMFVITCPVPTTSAEELAVAVDGSTVTITGPIGFSHVLELPPGARTERLHWDVFGGIFSLRAPNGGQARPAESPQ
jgi:HSP20 family molecular chaperone IbpA